MKTALLALTFIWCGLVLGLSFIETPLKFQAPDITRELGLGIGQLVFGALNKIEWFLSVATILLIVRIKPTRIVSLLFGVIVVIVLLQTVWLLPILDQRVELIRSGEEPRASAIHWIYIAADTAKVVSLLAAGIVLAQSKRVDS